ncbi:hypothetical protein BVRB_1g020670 [Beta vulgaris subsp. vulgaris]|uniref:Uncharacterized protein n=1 Tax=Beta vulgaris subsp. vulgaris TaxID=3555 RepID=A0A0J8BIF5_BETVV|nr:hypothetical protein BVRB_1g020670 [Beta vulgaris subsp. vulgaris]
MSTLPSQRWGYIRIITGTIAGGILGFYVMYRTENFYKAKWDERLKKYEEDKLKKEKTQLESEDTLFITDDSRSQQSSNE